MSHRWELDALRGLMLVLMTLTHLPTRFSDPFGQPFGFVSAAEGFVMLSAYMAGMVYTLRERRDGGPVMQEAFFKRALKIWLCQAALLMFAFTVIALIGLTQQQDAVNNLLGFYLEQPLTAFWSGMLLIYSPPLLDILPMYILFMLISPVLLLHGLQQGWLGIMLISVALWLAAQWEIGRVFYDIVATPTRMPVPLGQTGAFDIFAWQFLWVFGLWLGSRHAVGEGGADVHFPRWLLALALVIGVGCMLWRHVVGQAPFRGDAALNLLFDKWRLGPLRLIDFFALVILTMRFGPWLKAHLPRSRFLETLGAAALPVFCAHLVLVLLVLALLGANTDSRPLWVDLGILAATFAVLYTVAWASGELDRQAATAREKLKARRLRRQAAAGAGR